MDPNILNGALNLDLNAYIRRCAKTLRTTPNKCFSLIIKHFVFFKLICNSKQINAPSTFFGFRAFAICSRFLVIAKGTLTLQA